MNSNHRQFNAAINSICLLLLMVACTQKDASEPIAKHQASAVGTTDPRARYRIGTVVNARYRFNVGDYLENGNYQLVLQEDGNFVLYNLLNGQPLWATDTAGDDDPDAYYADLSQQANLVVYNASGVPLYDSGALPIVPGAYNVYLRLSDRGEIRIEGDRIAIGAPRDPFLKILFAGE